MTDLDASPLGHATTYSDRYDPGLLFPVDRGPQRAALGLAAATPFHGEDVWTAYEVSWLDAGGKPAVAIATLRVPASSPRIVESKSVKLYLTAFNQTRFASPAAVEATLGADLSAATGARVAVELTLPSHFPTLPRAEPAGVCIDDLPLETADAAPLTTALAATGPVVEETLFSRLFRSLCPVTGQPDYATLAVTYRGPAIDRAGLLRYVVSWRRHAGFHEHCVERIFMDVWRRCGPASLRVHARFTRRGGIDINPWRSSAPDPAPPNARTAQQ